jgi:hypothetical protein
MVGFEVTMLLTGRMDMTTKPYLALDRSSSQMGGEKAAARRHIAVTVMPA